MRRPFDDGTPSGHNSIVLRLALGAVVIAAALFAGILQVPSALLSTDGSARFETAAHQPLSCTDPDDGREWNPRIDPAAPATDSTRKWRTLHAALAAAADGDAIVAPRTETPAQPHAPPASAHLRHIPLLI